MKCKNVFLNFRALFLLKMFTFEVQVSFQSINQSISSYPISSYPINFFVRIYKIHDFDEAFLFLAVVTMTTET